MNLKNLMMWGIIVLLVVGLFQLFQNPNKTVVSYGIAHNLDKEQRTISRKEYQYNYILNKTISC